ncbi:amidohydrolase family protein [Sphingomonas sp. RS2018]
MRTIDGHLHFWRYDAAGYGWIGAGTPLAQDRLPEDVRVAMDAAGVAEGIAVQARQSEEETRWLLDLADQHDWIAGVVGWVDLRAPDVADRIAALAHPRLVGLRHIAQDEPDDRFLLRDDVVRGVRAGAAAGLTYDILVYARQAVHVPAFLDKAGDGRFVLDHGGKPDIAAGRWQPWANAVRDIARCPNVWCKLSGLVTEADHAAWAPDDIARYIDHLIDCFGPVRLIFGSDWPVCLLAADYGRVHALAADAVARRCPGHVAAIFGGNAVAAYRP